MMFHKFKVVGYVGFNHSILFMFYPDFFANGFKWLLMFFLHHQHNIFRI